MTGLVTEGGKLLAKGSSTEGMIIELSHPKGIWLSLQKVAPWDHESCNLAVHLML